MTINRERRDLTTGEAEAYQQGREAERAALRQRATESAPTQAAVWVLAYLAEERGA